MGKDHKPRTFSRQSGYKSDLEIMESHDGIVRINTSFGSGNHNAYSHNNNGTHEHMYYDPQTLKSGYHGENYETRNNHPKDQECFAREDKDIVNGTSSPITGGKTFDKFKRNTDIKRDEGKNNAHTGGNFSMAINEGTDFSEAAQEKAAAKYGEVIESIQTFSESVVTHFIERVKGHPYKQLEEAGNVFIRSYNEELPRKVKEAIRSWCQSENSFASSIAKQYDDNEESKSAALKVEKGIEDKVDTCFKNIAEIKINKPISVNAEAIISDAQYMEGLSKELKKEKEMWMGVFQKLGEQQNSLYSNMEELVAETFNKTEEEYQAVYKDIMNVSEEFKAARAAVIKSANTKASNVKDNIQNIVDQYTRRRKNKH